ncbi:hypothetical protein D3C84_1119360 [compost metagenome]
MSHKTARSKAKRLITSSNSAIAKTLALALTSRYPRISVTPNHNNPNHSQPMSTSMRSLTTRLLKKARVPKVPMVIAL